MIATRCSHPLIRAKFDATFRFPDRSERLVFGVPADFCEECPVLWIAPDLLKIMELDGAKCVFAIQSDACEHRRAIKGERFCIDCGRGLEW